MVTRLYPVSADGHTTVPPCQLTVTRLYSVSDHACMVTGLHAWSPPFHIIQYNGMVVVYNHTSCFNYTARKHKMCQLSTMLHHICDKCPMYVAPIYKTIQCSQATNSSVCPESRACHFSIGRVFTSNLTRVHMCAYIHTFVCR